MVAHRSGLLGRATARRETIDPHLCGRLSGPMMTKCPGPNLLPVELLPWVTTAELLQSVLPFIRTAA